MIRTAHSKTHTAVLNINSERRLALTGTPLQNSIHDLMAILNFLCSGMKTSYSKWPEILSPFLQQSKLKPLHLILRHAMLRRTKSTTLLWLPPIYHHTITIPLNPPTQAIYDFHFNSFLSCFSGEPPPTIDKETSFFKQLQHLCEIFDHPYWP